MECDGIRGKSKIKARKEAGIGYAGEGGSVGSISTGGVQYDHETMPSPARLSLIPGNPKRGDKKRGNEGTLGELFLKSFPKTLQKTFGNIWCGEDPVKFY